jgi:hypothetical protein
MGFGWEAVIQALKYYLLTELWGTEISGAIVGLGCECGLIRSVFAGLATTVATVLASSF